MTPAQNNIQPNIKLPINKYLKPQIEVLFEGPGCRYLDDKLPVSVSRDEKELLVPKPKVSIEIKVSESVPVFLPSPVEIYIGERRGFSHHEQPTTGLHITHYLDWRG